MKPHRKEFSIIASVCNAYVLRFRRKKEKSFHQFFSFAFFLLVPFFFVCYLPRIRFSKVKLFVYFLAQMCFVTSAKSLTSEYILFHLLFFPYDVLFNSTTFVYNIENSVRNITHLIVNCVYLFIRPHFQVKAIGRLCTI